MKRTAKRLLALCLILSALCACLVPGVSAADSVADLQKAIVETAMAYYYKGPYMQYDSTQLTAQSRLSHGESRISSGNPPEWAADDNTLFTVCSDYVYSVIYNAIGYKMTGSSRTCITRYLAEDLDPEKTPGVIFQTGGLHGGTYDPEAAVASEKLLQPGDVVTYYNKTKGTGHTGIYVGDVLNDGYGVYANSSGKKIDLKTGEDTIDRERNSYNKSGCVRLDGWDVLYYTKGAAFDVSDPTKLTSFSIIRPVLAAQQEGLSVTPAAKTRIQFHGIDVDRTSSVKKYNSVQNGDQFGITVTIANHGKTALSGVSVKEALPVGAAIDAASVKGGTLGADGITAKVNVPAGESVKLEYTVTVTGKRGDTVVIPAGSVENLTTRPLEFRVGGKALNSEAVKELQTSNGLRRIRALRFNGELDFVNALYKEFFGVDLGLPKTVQEFRDTQAVWTKVPGVGSGTYGGQMLWAKKDSDLTGDAKRYREMILPEHLAGWAVFLRSSPEEITDTIAAEDRVLELKPEFYQPGDIFFGYVHESGTNLNVYKPDVFVYQGGKNVIGFAEGSTTPTSFSFDKSIGLLLREDVLFALRPTLAYDDIGNVKTVSFPDVKESDWFYSYVTDLAKDGIVGGMSDGTFQPAGTLTYGQALKLLICALDKDVGNAASGHWASNYLSAAQSKGWITGSVNLDAGISRLSFCQIAAKAKGLTEQPASNPFTDTSDASVLALNKAGVIGGMGEGIFSPNTTLTRAQISKIIVELRKV